MMGLYALVGAALAAQDIPMAILLLMMFCGYLRPNEALTLRGKQLVPPQRGSSCKHWGLLLSPAEDLSPGKTGEFDESVLLDWHIFQSLSPLLLQWARKAKSQPIFQFGYAEFLKRFTLYRERAGLTRMGIHPYSLRHGGASHDRLEDLRGLQEVKKRGRWRADSSVRRYEKHTSVLKQLQEMPRDSLEFGLQIGRELKNYVLGKKKLPPLPLWGKRLRRKLERQDDHDLTRYLLRPDLHQDLFKNGCKTPEAV